MRPRHYRVLALRLPAGCDVPFAIALAAQFHGYRFGGLCVVFHQPPIGRSVQLDALATVVPRAVTAE